MSSYDSKLEQLNSILQEGIRLLLIEAKEKNYLDPPYGRGLPVLLLRFK